MTAEVFPVSKGLEHSTIVVEAFERRKVRLEVFASLHKISGWSRHPGDIDLLEKMTLGEGLGTFRAHVDGICHMWLLSL